MKQIYCGNGKYAIIDDDDYDRTNTHKWHLYKSSTGVYYAKRSKNENGKILTYYMHRDILNLNRSRIPEVDHIDHNGLNNQKSNLRICSHAENMANTGIKRTNTSGFKGVSYNKRSRKYISRVKINGKRKSLGYYTSAIEAAVKYNEAIEKHNNKYSYRNIIRNELPIC